MEVLLFRQREEQKPLNGESNRKKSLCRIDLKGMLPTLDHSSQFCDGLLIQADRKLLLGLLADRELDPQRSSGLVIVQ